jgi:hypothetical protein
MGLTIRSGFDSSVLLSFAEKWLRFAAHAVMRAPDHAIDIGRSERL